MSKKMTALALGLALGAGCLALMRKHLAANRAQEIPPEDHPGNADCYAPAAMTPMARSPLAGKRIYFLGSSVTEGSAALGDAFPDYLAALDGCESIKEAVSGTTLVDNGPDSYIPRMLAHRAEGKVDLLVCQLSTNDAARGLPLGRVSSGRKLEDFDTATVAGAIEFIIAWAMETYGCPVAFYTSPRFSGEAYGAMVSLLYRIRDKWGIGLIDMWSDSGFNALTAQERELYLRDPIHPTRAGYGQWWLPYFRERLRAILN